MEIQDEEVSTEEPQLRYWNPWRRGRSVFTATPTRPAPAVSPIHIVKMGAQSNAYCDDTQYTCLPSSVFDNQQPLNQDLFQSNGESSTQDLSSAGNEPNSSGLNIYIPLETVTPETTSLLLTDQVEDLKENTIKLEPEEFDDRFGPDPKDDILTFNSIDEALDSIDSPSTPDSNFSALSLQPSGNRMSLTNEKQEEVVKAAKSLFSKRTRTLYHWLFPDTSKNKLKATVSAAWETLSEGEKHFYISQVLGRFGLQASSLMVNPQLGGMKCIPNEIENKNEKKKNSPIEDQRAVDSLFDSCEDAGNWASFSEPKEQKPIIKVKPERRHRRKRQKSQKDVDVGTPDAVPSTKEEKATKNQKKQKKVHEEVQDFEEDPELTRELEKFRLITEAAEEDIWGDIPDPEELFADINF